MVAVLCALVSGGVASICDRIKTAMPSVVRNLGKPHVLAVLCGVSSPGRFNRLKVALLLSIFSVSVAVLRFHRGPAVITTVLTHQQTGAGTHITARRSRFSSCLTSQALPPPCLPLACVVVDRVLGLQKNTIVGIWRPGRPKPFQSFSSQCCAIACHTRASEAEVICV